MALTKEQIENYLKSTKKVILATTTKEGTPDLRILGGIGTIGTTLYFATASKARKVEQIANNPNVAVYYEAPGQEFPNYVNATLYGKAVKITDEKKLDEAVKAIRENLPKFEFTEEKDIYEVNADEIKIYNSSAELVQDRIQIEKYN